LLGGWPAVTEIPTLQRNSFAITAIGRNNLCG
jgi:hypothetical protein